MTANPNHPNLSTEETITQANVIALINRLNDHISENEPEGLSISIRPYQFITDGLEYQVKFLDNTIWTRDGNNNEFGLSFKMEDVLRTIKHETEHIIKALRTIKIDTIN